MRDARGFFITSKPLSKKKTNGIHPRSSKGFAASFSLGCERMTAIQQSHARVRRRRSACTSPAKNKCDTDITSANMPSPPDRNEILFMTLQSFPHAWEASICAPYVRTIYQIITPSCIIELFACIRRHRVLRTKISWPWIPPMNTCLL